MLDRLTERIKENFKCPKCGGSEVIVLFSHSSEELILRCKNCEYSKRKTLER